MESALTRIPVELPDTSVNLSHAVSVATEGPDFFR